MPLSGEYEPSTSAWARKQAELYEATHGREGGDLRGRAVIVRNDSVVLAEGNREQRVTNLGAVPLTRDGKIGFQVDNVLAATAAQRGGA